ncbi:MAG: type 4a pilus biogenesis protein PilO [Candidatus Eiseniibacteriota bacterium]
MANIDFRDPNVQIAGLVCFVAVAVAGVFFLTPLLPFGFKPKAEQIATLEREYEEISADLMKAKQTASRLPQVQAEYEQLVARWEEAKTLLPTEKEMAELLTQVTVAGQRSGVDFVLFEPKPPVPRDIYQENAIAVTVQGGYHEIGLFLGRVSNLPRIVNVNQIDMKNVVNPNDKDLPQMVEASLQFAAYTLLPEGTAPAAAVDGQPPQATQAAAAAPAGAAPAKGGNRAH